MLVLLASLVALFLGPLLLVRAGRSQVVAALDAFVLVAVVGLVVLALLPHALADGGWWAALAAFAGLLLPTIAERAAHTRGHGWILMLAIAGLAVHAMVDGAGLSAEGVHPHVPDPDLHEPHGHGHGHGHSGLIAAGVLLHRLPVGMVVWGAVQPRRGTRWAVGLLGLIAAATIAGYAIGHQGLSALPSMGFAIFEALVAGSLLHVVFHDGGVHGEHCLPMPGRLHVPAVVGAAAGAAVLVVLTATHPIPVAIPDAPASADVLAALALRCAPWLVLALLAAAALATLPPRFRRVLPPGLAPDATLLPLPLLGVPLTLARFVGATVLEVVRRDRPEADPRGPLDAAIEAFEHAAPWFVVGLALCAVVAPTLDPAVLTDLPAVAQIPLLALVGAPVAIGAAAAAPIAALLVVKGATAGAALAFLLLAPLTIRPRDTLGLVRVAAAFAVACGAGAAFDAFVTLPDLPDVLAAVAPTVLELGCLAALGLALLASLLRRGPRTFLRQVTGADWHGHDHGHTHGTDEAHGPHHHDHDHV